MRCEEVNKLIMDYIDGRLGRFKTEKFERHIEACRACREEYEAELKMASAFDIEAEGIAGPFFVEDVFANIDTALEREYALLRINGTPKIVALAGAVAVMVVALVLWSTGWGAFGESGTIRLVIADASTTGGEWFTGLGGLLVGVYDALAAGFHSVMAVLGAFSAHYTSAIAILTALCGIASVGLIERFRRKFAEELRT